MASSRSMQKEIEALKKEIASLRASQSRWKRKAETVAVDGGDLLGTIRDDIAEKVTNIKNTISGGAGDAADEITEQLEELRETINGYSEQAEKTVAAHPLVAVAGAVAIGWLIGRMTK